MINDTAPQSTDTDHIDSSVVSSVTKLKCQLEDLQTKLGRALKRRGGPPEDEDRDGGYVDVEFVRTKPKCKWTKCKQGISKTILHPFYAEFPEGSVTALMGPSGAETTLLDFLTGMLGNGVLACGTVCLPDSDVYVPQDDRLHSFYTCRSYMDHYARLSGQKSLLGCCGRTEVSPEADEENIDQAMISSEITRDNKTDKLIDDILDEVGLSYQKDTIVGGVFKRGLSGGQKRRLSVALVALSSPLNMFLDEPTSGLDSESALHLMEYLNKYARSRDPATGLKRRGRLIYQGRRDQMDEFFSAQGHPVPLNYNPSDHFIEALSEAPKDYGNGDGESVDERNVIELWYECFKQWNDRASLRTLSLMYDPEARRSSFVIRSSPGKVKLVNKIGNSASRKFRNAFELTRRAFESMIRDPIVLGLRVAIYSGISLVLGILFLGLDKQINVHAVMIGRTALLYFIIAFCSSMSLAAIPFSIIERAIVEKEVRNHLFHPAFYHVSQATACLPACFILSLLAKKANFATLHCKVTTIVFTMTGLGIKAQTALILFLTFYCADATSMLVSHIAPDLISALCISSGVFGFFTIVMGFLVTPSDMSPALSWAYYLPFMTYSFRSLMFIYYSEVKFFNDTYVNVTNDTQIPVDEMFHNMTGFLGEPHKLDGSLVLNSFEMAEVNVNMDICVLILWAVVAHLMSLFYLVLSKFKRRRVFVYNDKEADTPQSDV